MPRLLGCGGSSTPRASPAGARRQAGWRLPAAFSFTLTRPERRAAGAVAAGRRRCCWWLEICSGSLISSALACCLLTLLALSLQAVFVLLPLTATRTVLSRVVSDPRARHRALLRREAGQAGVSAPSRARERKAAWRASSSIGRSWSSSLRAPCGVRAGAGVHRRTSWTPSRAATPWAWPNLINRSCVLAIIFLIYLLHHLRQRRRHAKCRRSSGQLPSRAK